jgi:cytosine/creatinine deaminase
MASMVIKENKGTIENEHHKFMALAQKEATESQDNGGIPVGAVLVKNGEIIGRGHNKRIQLDSTILHAEMECLESAGRMKASEYKKCTLYTTLSPCAMCSGAIILYNIPMVVMGENENFKGPEEYLLDKGVQLINLNLDSCKKMLGNFIEKHPELWNEDICL